MSSSQMLASVLRRGMRLSNNYGNCRHVQVVLILLVSFAFFAFILNISFDKQLPIGIFTRRIVTTASCLASEAASAKTSNHKTNSAGPSGSTSPAKVFVSGCYMLPHPDKAAEGGEDWYFIGSNQRSVGVADGVGGWAEIGVDAGAYARQLMRNAQEEAERETEGQVAQGVVISPQRILEAAHRRTTVRGSSTACVAALNAGTLSVSNLGDSGLMVLRGGEVVFHTPQQQHGFNFPYQLGSQDSMGDSPQAAQVYEFEVLPGDCVVLGTDGLWDNCFNEEIAAVVRNCLDHKMNIAKTAQVLANYARYRASDAKYASPFAYSAFQAGFAYMGGKMDDITVVVALVQGQAEAEAAAEAAEAEGESAAAAQGDAPTPGAASKL